MSTEIYLDGNATSAVLPAAIDAAVDVMRQRFGNPSSTHAAGLQAKAVLEQARACAARLLGVGPGRLMFNSGATEGIQTAVLSALCALRQRQADGEAIGSLLLYGATEHKAVPHSLAHWNGLLGLNLTVQALPVDGDGRHDLATLRALAPRAALVCTMAANNETGVISDLAGIEAVLRDSGTAAYWLVDGVQALGKLALNLAASRIDYAPFSGHKLYAPKGVGMLYVRAGAPYTPLIVGGGQEEGWRSGTENMAGVAALGAVLAALERGGTFRSHAELERFRQRLADSLRAALPGVVFNQPFAASLPTTLNFSVPGVSGRDLMDVFDAAGVRVSSGSACSARKAAPSYVLEAMGIPAWRAGSAIRLSFGPLMDEGTVAAACARIARCGEALRAGGLIPSPGAAGPQDGVLQLGVDGACTWLLLDAASRACVVIDPLPEHTARIVALLRSLQYQVRAILATAAEVDRAALVGALGAQFDRHASTDDCGWPVPGGGAVALADGTTADSLPLGGLVLASAPHGPVETNAAVATQAAPATQTAQATPATPATPVAQATPAAQPAPARRSYLLGAPAGGQLPVAAVRYAFCASAAQPGSIAWLHADTLLCPSRDAHNQICTSLRALAAPAADEQSVRLAPSALQAFLQAHPGVRLIDVREPWEQAATSASAPAGRPALSAPLSQLTTQLGSWLHGGQDGQSGQGLPPPLLLFCRSGNRSLKAAQCLRRLGYRQAWSLDGGLALASSASPVLTA